MSSLYTIGQMNEVADAFEGDGFTANHLKVMVSGGRLTAIKLYLDGDAEIVPKPKPVSLPEPFLRSISEGKKITVPACTRLRVIAHAEDVFTWGIDGDFVRWNLDVPSVATPATDVEVHELIRDGKFEDIYGSTGVDLDKLVLTQDQVISFVETHKKWLRKDGNGTFFLFKEEVDGVEQFFVAIVHVASGLGPSAHVRRLSLGFVWSGDDGRRFVFPQLTPKP